MNRIVVKRVVTLTKMKRSAFSGFTYGMICAFSIIGIVQEVMGKEAYIEFVEETWLSVPVWIWAVSIVVSVVVPIVKQVRLFGLDKGV